MDFDLKTALLVMGCITLALTLGFVVVMHTVLRP